MAPGPARILLLALALPLGCARESPRDDFPGMRLLAQLEARLAREQAQLAPMLDHYGLVFPVSQAQLQSFMAQIRVHGAGGDLALGTEFGPESHGGGLLRLLFDDWRPEGRAPRLDDRFAFAPEGRALALGDLYRAELQQLVLPALDAGDPLPRVRFGFQLPGGPLRAIDLDAYKLVSLVLELEPDPRRTWTNRLGQALSREALMRRVRAHYLASPAPRADPPDHSNLHLVELLVAEAAELAPVQQHFLAAELAQRDFAAEDEAFLLAHFAESLGRLLEAESLAWGDADRRRVRDWLGELETRRFRDVEALDLESLCHLVHGLRAVRAHQVKLE